MTINERHEAVKEMFAELEAFYEKHFPPKRPLMDDEWESYLDGIWNIVDHYKGTSLENLASELTMALSNDIERVDKAWRRRNEVQKTE